jgi:predicted lipoprotein
MGLVLASSLGVSLAFACRKASPDEVVNGKVGAGGSSSSGGTGNLAGSAGAPPLPDSGIELSCDVPEPHADSTFTKQKLLEAAADCAMYRYCRFEGAASALRDASRAFADNPDTTRRDNARAAWRQAIDTWEEAELFSFGPAASQTEPGGKDFRNLIYSWPLNGRCKVDEQTVNRFYESPDFFGPPNRSLVNGRTLSALEYLAYYEGTDNGCHQLSPINANQTWSALDRTELTRRKAAYAAAAAEDVLANARALAQAWSPEHGNFRATLTHTGNAVYASEQAALNAISDAMFYLERQVKDQKLGIPLGLLPECTTPPCVDAIESRYANASIDHVRANLRGFRALFQGCGAGNSGIGFDDWLNAVGSGELATRMLQALDAADAAAAGVNSPLQDALVSDRARVEALHTAIRNVATPLKTEFVTVLNLELPKTSEGDND